MDLDRLITDQETATATDQNNPGLSPPLAREKTLPSRSTSIT